MKPFIPIIVILLLVGMSIPSTGRVMEQSSTISSDSITLYVGGSGEGNYTKIQDAIDNASDGDTVFVYNGTYDESLDINKSIELLGENRETTIISYVDFHDTYDVKISGFTTRKLSFFLVKNAIITKNNIFGNGTYGSGIEFIIVYGDFIISDNKISYWEYDGIQYYYYGSDATIKIFNNTFSNNNISGVYLEDDGHIIEHNIFINNHYGLMLHSSKCEISNNTFKDNFLGFYTSGEDNFVHHNNFIKNTRGAFFRKSSLYHSGNEWDKNYWNKPREKPKPIFGNTGVSAIITLFLMILIYVITHNSLPENVYNYIGDLLAHFWLIPIFVDFDWHPAQEPYDIEV